jgi:hypothetical protein
MPIASALGLLIGSMIAQLESSKNSLPNSISTF